MALAQSLSLLACPFSASALALSVPSGALLRIGQTGIAVLDQRAQLGLARCARTRRLQEIPSRE